MKPSYHTTRAGHKLAYVQQKGEGTGVIFCAGFRSDMASTKAVTLAEWCAQKNIPFTRFDYFAHGQSEGDFIDFTIGRAFEDTLEILDSVANGPQILVGSSMGGWVSMLAAAERKRQVLGFVGVAPAPDFTDWMWRDMSREQREELESEGRIYVHSEYYNNDYPVTKALIDDGRKRFLTDDAILLDLPLHILQGQRDDSVPWEHALKIAGQWMGDDVKVTLIKDGDHRLNRPQDLGILLDAVERMRAQIDSQ